MSQYVLTREAESDLEAIEEYLSGQSREAASRVLAEVREAMRRLAKMPDIGHLREDLADEPLGFWTVYSYLIVYRPETQPLQVIRVLHGAQDVRAILEDR